MSIIYQTKIGNTVIKVADDYITGKEESKQIIERISRIASYALQVQMKSKQSFSEVKQQ